MITLQPIEDLKDFISNKTGGTYSTETAAFIGWSVNGKLKAVVACTDYTGRSCQLHIAVDGFVRPYFYLFCFQYAFNQLGVNTILTTIDSTNIKSKRLSEHLGFKCVYTIQDAGKYGDIYLMSMKRFECRIMSQAGDPENPEN